MDELLMYGNLSKSEFFMSRKVVPSERDSIRTIDARHRVGRVSTKPGQTEEHLNSVQDGKRRVEERHPE